MRAHEHALVDRYKGMESHSVQVEQDVAGRAREQGRWRSSRKSLQREGRAVALEQEVSTARGERAVALEQGSLYGARARWRSNGQPVKPPSRRHGRPRERSRQREGADAAVSMRRRRSSQRLADLGKLVGEATAARGGSDAGKARQKRHAQFEGEVAPGSAAMAATGSRRRSSRACGNMQAPKPGRVCHRSNIRRSGHRLDHLSPISAMPAGRRRHGSGRAWCRNLRRGRAHQGRQRPGDV